MDPPTYDPLIATVAAVAVVCFALGVLLGLRLTRPAGSCGTGAGCETMTRRFGEVLDDRDGKAHQLAAAMEFQKSLRDEVAELRIENGKQAAIVERCMRGIAVMTGSD